MEEFTVGVKRNREWDLTVALSFSLEGVGSALYLLAMPFGVGSAALLGLGVACAGGAVLLVHLGHPGKFWRVMANPAQAWMSRGALFVAAFLIAGGLTLVVPPGSVSQGALRLMQLVAAVLAVLVMLYGGLLLSSLASIPFWNTPLLPVLFLTHSLASAGTILGSVAQLGWGEEMMGSSWSLVLLVLIALSLGLTVLYPALGRRNIGARAAVEQLIWGRYRHSFVVVGLLGGLLAPLVLFWLCHAGAPAFASAVPALVGVATLLRLGGDVGFRYAVLNVGFFDPII